MHSGSLQGKNRCVELTPGSVTPMPCRVVGPFWRCVYLTLGSRDWGGTTLVFELVQFESAVLQHRDGRTHMVETSCLQS